MNFQYDSNQDIDKLLDDKETQISDEVQKDLNKPIQNPNGFDAETLAFITEVMQRVYSGEINVFTPSSLINQSVYSSVSEEIQGKADLLAISLCAKLRELKALMELSGGDKLFIEPTYQAALLVQDIKYRKTEFESRFGDIFVI